MDLKNWFQKRELRKKEAEIVDTPESLEKLLASLNIETRVLLKNHLSKSGKIDLNDIESFIKNPKSIEHLYKDEPKFYQNFIKQKYLFCAKNLCKSLYYLSSQDLNKMAIDPKDFQEKIEPHIDDNGKNIVNHKDQMQQFPAHPEYSKMLKDPNRFKASPIVEGIAAKMVHIKNGYTDEDGDFVHYGNEKNKHTFMTKPYHPVNDDADLTRFPLHGWATIATKALFNAGKIGHLCEDVGIHEHENKPVTVHKFNNDAVPLFNIGEGHKFDSTEVHQIGVMDYLANNLDRHLGNLMAYKDDKNKSTLLGIDHERNFVYQNSLTDQSYDVTETPFGYSRLRGLERARRMSDLDKPIQPFVDWWKKNGMNIQKEFAKQTGHITDPAIRKHVYDNFMGRWERMDDWAKQANKKSSYRNLYDDESFESATIKPFNQPINKKILAALPKNPRDAVSALYEVANKRQKLDLAQSHQVTEAFKNIIGKMSPEDLADIYKSSLENPNWEIYGSKAVPKLRSIILDHLLKPEEYHKNKPLYKLNHIKAIADTIDSLPEGHNKGLIQKQQAKKLRSLINKVTRKAA